MSSDYLYIVFPISSILIFIAGLAAFLGFIPGAVVLLCMVAMLNVTFIQWRLRNRP